MKRADYVFVVQKFLLEMFIGFAMFAGGSWTRVLLIVDGEDLDNCPASEFYVKDSKSQLVAV